MSRSAALIDVKSDVKSQGLEDSPSKPFFLTVRKKHLTHEQIQIKFTKAFPGWDKVNGDDYHINNTILRVPETSSGDELDFLVAWLEANLKGEFHVAGVYYPCHAVILFQFKDDMDKARAKFA